MPNRSPQVDAYIAAAQPFLCPILKKLRMLFHRGCPKLVETMKWNAPFFEHKGILGMMAGFKKNVKWGFWNAKLLNQSILNQKQKAPTPMSLALTDVSQLPKDKWIVDLVRQAADLNERGIKLTKAKPGTRPSPKPTPDLMAALKKNPKAAATFSALSPSCKREYVDWITDAKKPETRERRIAQAIDWMTQGKSRNWKYENRK